MQPIKWNNILAFQTPEGKFWGLNSKTLSLAEISDDVWNLVRDQAIKVDQNAMQSLQQWNDESAVATKPDTTINPRVLTINVTQVCNLQCTYCAAGGDGTYGNAVKKISVEKTLPQIKWFLEKCPPTETFAINFLGGEPLLYPQGIELISEYATELAQSLGINLKLTVITNGTLFNQTTVDVIKKCNLAVSISLDGPKELNDQFRVTKSGAGSTDSVVKGIQFLKQHSPNTVMMASGVFGGANANPFPAYMFYRSLGFDFYEFTFDHDSKAEHVPMTILNSEDQNASNEFVAGFNKILEHAYQNGQESELLKIQMINKLFHNLDTQALVKHYCGAGNSFFMIDSQNQVFACPWDVNDKSEKIGHESVLNSDAVSKYLDPISKQTDCQSCWAKNLCAGGCSYIHKRVNGDKNKPVKSFCDRTRSLLLSSILYYLKCRSPEGEA